MRNSKYRFLPICLNLFDGGAAGGAAGAGTGAPTAAAAAAGDGSTKADTTSNPGSSRRGKTGETEKVVYGKQETNPEAAPQSSAAESKTTDVKTTSNTLEEKRARFKELIDGEFKDLYTQETQNIINRRFKETKNLEEQLNKHKPVLDMLSQKYGVADGDVTKLTQAIEEDNSFFEEAAEEAGMTVDQYKKYQKTMRENAELREAQKAQQNKQLAEQQLQKWYGEAEKLKAEYPNFDLAAETQNEMFVRILKTGVPMKNAYEVIHMDDIKNGVAQTAAKTTEKNIVETIKAKGSRPSENGVSSQSAIVIKDDVSKLTKKDRQEIARRAARGENIRF
jgi:hypothetical protein